MESFGVVLLCGAAVGSCDRISWRAYACQFWLCFGLGLSFKAHRVRPTCPATHLHQLEHHARCPMLKVTDLSSADGAD
jgi:hypothetical protein